MNGDSKKETPVKIEEERLEASKENIINTKTDFSEGIPKEIEIDSFVDLHSFDKEKFQYENCSEFTIKMLWKLDRYRTGEEDKNTLKYNKVTLAQNKLLGITEYLCDKTFRINFGMYIFHSSNMESHYTNSIQLFTISNKTNKFNNLILSQQYLREGYEYDITSRFLTMNEIEVTKEEKFNTSNNSPEDDSISFTKTNYLIKDEGEIVLIK